MKALIQRVKRASVEVEGEIVGSIDHGLLALIGVELFNLLVTQTRTAWPHVATGEFGADMQVALINDGPVTFLLES